MKVENLTVISLEKTCAAFPSQWEGLTKDNRQIYYRFRWGRLTVSVGEQNDKSKYAAVRGIPVLSLNISDGFDGILPTSDMIVITKRKINYEIPKKELLAMEKVEEDQEKIDKEFLEIIFKRN